MKRLAPKAEKQFSPRFIRLAKIGGVIFLLFLILEVWMVNRLSTYGNKIEQLKSVEGQIILENQILESEIAQKSALLTLEKKSKILGFETIKKVLYIKDSSPSAETGL